MKKIKMFIFTLFTFLLVIPVFALEKGSDYNYSNVKDIAGYNGGYFLLKNNGEIIKYGDNDKILIKKKFSTITPDGIVSYSGNYVLYGESNNLLNVYILDNNLRVVHNSSLNIPINGSIVKTYLYDGKLYLITSIDGVISNNKVVVMDKSFNIEMKAFSDISEFNNIIGSDYYLYNDNNEEGNNYLASSRIGDNNYLVGYSVLDGVVSSVIKMNDTITTGEENYKNIDSLVIDGKFYVLSKGDKDSKLIVYDENINMIESIDVPNNSVRLDKYVNKLAVVCSNKIITYNFDYNIIKEDSLFGSLEISGESKPYSLVKVNALANSSYEISNIIVKTSSGELVEVNNNEFIMPEDSVSVSVEYKELVKNPETLDFIIIFAVLGIALLIVVKQLYSKYKWLK